MTITGIPGSHFEPRLKLTVVVFPVSTVASCVVVPRGFLPHLYLVFARRHIGECISATSAAQGSVGVLGNKNVCLHPLVDVAPNRRLVRTHQGKFDRRHLGWTALIHLAVCR